MKQIFALLSLSLVVFLLLNSCVSCVKKGERKRSVRDVQNALKDKFEPVYQNYLKNIGLNEKPDRFTSR